MKKGFLLVLTLCLTLGLMAPVQAEEDEFRIVASFYPMYVLTMNITEGIEGVTLASMTAPEAGCLHDYQLRPGDMRLVAEADAFVVNGAGMESFLDRVMQQAAALPIIDASEGIDLLYGEHLHEAEDHSHEHDAEMPNGHVWLDPRNAARQVRNIGAGLAAADPAHGEAYLQNAEAYAAKLEGLYEEWKAELTGLADRRLVTFHDAFPYFAQAFDLSIEAVLHVDAETQPGTRELAELVDLVNEGGIRALFTEPQFDPRTAEVVSKETGAKVYELDPIVTGDYAADAYEQRMAQNIQTLKEALAQ